MERTHPGQFTPPSHTGQTTMTLTPKGNLEKTINLKLIMGGRRHTLKYSYLINSVFISIPRSF